MDDHRSEIQRVGIGPGHDRALICVLAACAGFGTVPLFARVLLDLGLSAEAVAFYRYALSFALVLPWLRIRAQDLGAAVKLAATGLVMGLGLIGYIHAIATAPIAMAGVVYMTYPVLVVPIAWLLFGKSRHDGASKEWSHNGRALAAGLLILIATIVITRPSAITAEQAWALLICLPAPLGFALGIVVISTVGVTLFPLQRMALILSGTVPGLLPLVLLRGGDGLVPNEPQGWLWILGISLVTATIPQYLYTVGAPRIGAPKAAVAGGIELPTMLLIGFLAYGEVLGWREAVACGLVIAALAIAPTLRTPSR